MTVNGQLPGPALRFKEGEDVVLNVKKDIDVDTSIHWHGIILPYTQDAVHGISSPCIQPGEAFTYRFKQIGRAHVCTSVTNSPLVFRHLLEKKKQNIRTSTN